MATKPNTRLTSSSRVSSRRLKSTISRLLLPSLGSQQSAFSCQSACILASKFFISTWRPLSFMANLTRKFTCDRQREFVYLKVICCVCWRQSMDWNKALVSGTSSSTNFLSAWVSFNRQLTIASTWGFVLATSSYFYSTIYCFLETTKRKSTTSRDNCHPSFKSTTSKGSSSSWASMLPSMTAWF